MSASFLECGFCTVCCCGEIVLEITVQPVFLLLKRHVDLGDTGRLWSHRDTSILGSIWSPRPFASVWSPELQKRIDVRSQLRIPVLRQLHLQDSKNARKFLLQFADLELKFEQ